MPCIKITSDVMQRTFCASVNCIFFNYGYRKTYFCRWNRYLLSPQSAKYCYALRQPIATAPRRTLSPISYALRHVLLCSRRSSVSVATAERKHDVIITQTTHSLYFVSTQLCRCKIQRSTIYSTVSYILVNLH